MIGKSRNGSSDLAVEGGFEASGVAEGSADVVGQVAGAQSGAAEVLETAVDRLGRPVGRVWAAEVGHDVRRCLRTCGPVSEAPGARQKHRKTQR